MEWLSLAWNIVKEQQRRLEVGEGGAYHERQDTAPP
jgi:hypothetical protein